MKISRVISWIRKHVKIGVKNDLLLDDYWKERHDTSSKKVARPVFQKNALDEQSSVFNGQGHHPVNADNNS